MRSVVVVLLALLMMTLVNVPGGTAGDYVGEASWLRVVDEDGTHTVAVTFTTAADTRCRASAFIGAGDAEAARVGVWAGDAFAVDHDQANVAFTATGNDTVFFGASDARRFEGPNGTFGPAAIFQVSCGNNITITQIREGSEVRFLSTGDDGAPAGIRHVQAAWGLSMASTEVHFVSHLEPARLGPLLLPTYYEAEATLATPDASHQWTPERAPTSFAGPAGRYALTIDLETTGGHHAFIGMFLGLDG